MTASHLFISRLADCNFFSFFLFTPVHFESSLSLSLCEDKNRSSGCISASCATVNSVPKQHGPMCDSFWDWKINNQFEVDPVIQIAGSHFDVRRKSQVADVRLRLPSLLILRMIHSPRLRRVLRSACFPKEAGAYLRGWKGWKGVVG